MVKTGVKKIMEKLGHVVQIHVLPFGVSVDLNLCILCGVYT